MSCFLGYIHGMMTDPAHLSLENGHDASSKGTYPTIIVEGSGTFFALNKFASSQSSFEEASRNAPSWGAHALLRGCLGRSRHGGLYRHRAFGRARRPRRMRRR